MRKSLLFCLLAMFAFSCEKGLEETNSPEEVRFALTATTVEEPNTKVNLEDLGESGISVTWQNTPGHIDNFTVYHTETKAWVGQYVYQGANGAKIGDFHPAAGNNDLLEGESYTAVMPAVSDVNLTLDDYNADIADYNGLQKQDLNMNHLNSSLKMKAEFTYNGDLNTGVNFSHESAIMTFKFKMDEGKTPQELNFKDGAQEYNLSFGATGLTTANVDGIYTAYIAINPNPGGERKLEFTITATDGSQKYYSATTTKEYKKGYRYTAPINSLIGATPISTVAELQAMKDDLNGNYILMNDITFNGETMPSIGTSKSATFSGTFDGWRYIYPICR